LKIHNRWEARRTVGRHQQARASAHHPSTQTPAELLKSVDRHHPSRRFNCHRSGRLQLRRRGARANLHAHQPMATIFKDRQQGSK